MFILEALYFFLPAYIANIAPVIAAKVFPKWNTPIDFDKKLQGKPILGSHKTWRGLFSGIVLAILIVYLQTYLLKYSFWSSITLIDYELQNLVYLGFLFGFGALLGDAVKSFFKRRLGMESGSKWILFDQLDFVIGALLLVSFVYQPSVQHVLVIIVISPLLHVLTNLLGYKIGIKNVPW